MKIDLSPPQLAPTVSTLPPARPARPQTPGATDSLHLSEASALANADSAAETSPFDDARVAEIKAAIAEGRFRINPETIADSIIRTAQELIEAQRKA
ncbi:MAG: flagellar biosynthesis anti-sigma factor FlgM [Zoogloeaceae bacterium]|nr:flagellar biosynthesis anti-sigma factor FlgM [Zoogloeaceae bacterium]